MRVGSDTPHALAPMTIFSRLAFSIARMAEPGHGYPTSSSSPGFAIPCEITPGRTRTWAKPWHSSGPPGPRPPYFCFERSRHVRRVWIPDRRAARSAKHRRRAVPPKIVAIIAGVLLTMFLVCGGIFVLVTYSVRIAAEKNMQAFLEIRQEKRRGSPDSARKMGSNQNVRSEWAQKGCRSGAGKRFAEGFFSRRSANTGSPTLIPRLHDGGLSVEEFPE